MEGKDIKKEGSTMNIISYLISGYIILRGFMLLGQGNMIWGGVMLAVGIGGVIYKISQRVK